MNTVHGYLLRNLRCDSAGPLGPKPTDLTRRREEARRISELMSADPAFSLLRMGDMQLTMLIAHQEGLSGIVDTEGTPVSGTAAGTNLGLSLRHARYHAGTRVYMTQQSRIG